VSAAPVGDLWRYETFARGEGHVLIAGLDEVGRGPLAGPVVAACVVLPPDFSLDGIADSKKLSERQRERAYARITAEALAVGLGQIEAGEIDRINILRATHAAMRLALRALAIAPTLVLVDGLRVPDLPCPASRFLVGGDNLSASIAAASIVAKVTRDRQMIEADKQWPEYGFAGHKGYGAPKHLAALQEHGPCPLHRRSFSPVAAVCDQEGAAVKTSVGTLRTRCPALPAERWIEVNLSAQYLIAWQGETLVFIEVKTRHVRRGAQGTPAEAVGPRKQKQIVALASAYLAHHSLDDVPCRFDVVEVVERDGAPPRFSLLVGAFDATE